MTYSDILHRSSQEIQLYCKSNKDGKQISDCPFTQFIQVPLIKNNKLSHMRSVLTIPRICSSS
jgi:hypothetical protein